MYKVGRRHKFNKILSFKNFFSKIKKIPIIKKGEKYIPNISGFIIIKNGYKIKL